MHAERHEDLGIAAGILADRVAGGELGRLIGGRLAGLETGGKIQRQQKRERPRRQPADRRMKEEAGGQIDGQPGQIEEGDRPRPGEEQADLVEILRRPQDIAPELELQRRAGDHAKDALGQRGIDDAGKPGENAHPQHVEQAGKGKQQKGEDRKGNQRRHALRRDDAIIDLQHVERPGQTEKVEHQTDDGRPDKRPAHEVSVFSTPRHIRRTADISQSHVRPTGDNLQRGRSFGGTDVWEPGSKFRGSENSEFFCFFSNFNYLVFF